MTDTDFHDITPDAVDEAQRLLRFYAARKDLEFVTVKADGKTITVCVSPPSPGEGIGLGYFQLPDGRIGRIWSIEGAAP